MTKVTDEKGKEVRFEIPEGAKMSACRGCDAPIYFVRMKSGHMMPVDEDGGPHWATCAYVGKFRR